MQDRMMWYELMDQREALDKDGRFDYQLLLNGDRGENELVRLLLEQGFEDIWWRRNLWLARQVECDVILVTYEKIYVLNAKNYYGEFIYRDHVAYFNGKPLQNDPIGSFQLSLGRLKKLLREAGIDVAVEGRLVFMNPDYSVDFDDSVSVECVSRYNVLKLLAEIDTKARHVGRQHGLHPEAVGAKLLALESDSKYNLPMVQDVQVEKMAAGFVCPKCRSCRGMTVSINLVTCRCRQYTVSKRVAVSEAINEYCHIFHHRESFTSLEIYNFLGGQVRRRYISRLLKEQFKLAAFGSTTAYVNPYYRNPNKYDKPFR